MSKRDSGLPDSPGDAAEDEPDTIPPPQHLPPVEEEEDVLQPQQLPLQEEDVLDETLDEEEDFLPAEGEGEGSDDNNESEDDNEEIMEALAQRLNDLEVANQVLTTANQAATQAAAAATLLAQQAQQAAGAAGGGPNAPNHQVSGSQLNQLPEFDGSASKDVDIWIWNVERCARQFNWTDAMRCAAAQGRMTGAAAYWLHAKQLAGINFNTWTDGVGDAQPNLKTALLARFKILINALVAADAVTNLDQKKTEAVSDFYDRVIVAVDRKNFSYTAAQKANDDYKEKMMADVFVFFHAGLLPYIKSRATSGTDQPITAPTLLSSAIQAELHFAKKGKPIPIEAVESVQRSGKQFKRPFDLAKVKCFNCNVLGHFSKDCTAPRRAKKGSPKKSPAKPVFSVEEEKSDDIRAENDEGGYQ